MFLWKEYFLYKNSNIKTSSFIMFKLCIKVLIYENENGRIFSYSKFKLLRCYELWSLWLMNANWNMINWKLIQMRFKIIDVVS